LPQPGRSEIGTFFDGVWITGYAPLTDRTLKVIPIFAALAWITGTIALSTARTSAIRRTFLQADAVHLPVWPVSSVLPSLPSSLKRIKLVSSTERSFTLPLGLWGLGWTIVLRWGNEYRSLPSDSIELF